MSLPLTDDQRHDIHDLALDARELLAREARELLEGAYGLYTDGRLDPPEKLPQVAADLEAADGMGAAGLPPWAVMAAIGCLITGGGLLAASLRGRPEKTSWM